MMDLRKKADELEKKAAITRYIADIYDKTVTNMQWDSMSFHEADEEHDETWFTEPTEEDGQYRLYAYEAYQLVLQAIEKLVK